MKLDAATFATASLSGARIGIQMILTLMSAFGNASKISSRTARAPVKHSGHVGESSARNRVLDK